VAVGQVFLGKYRVDAILGHGGMGIVAECMHLALNERRAVKMLRRDVLMDHDAVQRFIREAQAAVKLKSEYVAKVHDVGAFENGVPYMEMEFLEGYDLGELLKQRKTLPVPWACELMLQTCEALAEAHSLAIVHRDVKPTNLFVTWRPDGSALIKVLDFGISKSPMGSDMNLTQTQSLLGTPAYMSPEQMRSARLVDTRTDIWSLGTVMYEVLEGRKPFEAESFSEMCVKVAVDPPAPMVNTPPALQQVILRCLAKAPEQRYATMAELGHDLVPFVTDTHQAGVLVERMNRMLRRSQDFSGDSSMRTPLPRQVQDLSSGPVVVPRMTPPSQWAQRSEPAIPAFQTAASYDPARTFDESRPIDAQRLPRKRWPYALLGLVLAGGVTTALVMSVGADEDSPPTTTVKAPQTEQAPAPTQPQSPRQIDTQHATEPAKAEDPKPAGSASVSGAPIEAKGSDASSKHVGSTHRGSDIASKTPKQPKTSPKESKDPHTVKTATPPTNTGSGAGSGTGSGTKCDPFDAMHRC
jgi:serine/threonine-protein kinase